MSDERFKPITQRHAAALLTVINMAEPNRARGGSQTILADTAILWANLLDGVDADFAANYLQGAYKHARMIPMSPGEIREAWDRYQSRQDSRDEQARRAEQREYPSEEDLINAAPPWFKEFRDTIGDAAATLRARGVKPSDPEWRDTIDPLDAALRKKFNIRAPIIRPNDPDRACTVKECQCQHVTCFKGWLPEDEEYTVKGRMYRRVHRCPTCAEAVDVRETLAAEQQPRRRWR